MLQSAKSACYVRLGEGGYGSMNISYGWKPLRNHTQPWMSGLYEEEELGQPEQHLINSLIGF